MAQLHLQEISDLNLKEQYNKFYSSEDVDDTASLVQFLDTVLNSKIENLDEALELGVGVKSALFSSKVVAKIKEVSLLDFSDVALEKLKTKYQASFYQLEVGVQDLGFEYFDLILDAHCFHCIVDEGKREIAFKTVYEALKAHGVFCGQMMIGKEVKTFKGTRFIPTARELEEEILKTGFSLEYFVIVSDLHYELNDKSKVELVRFIARK